MSSHRNVEYHGDYRQRQNNKRSYHFSRDGSNGGYQRSGRGRPDTLPAKKPGNMVEHVEDVLPEKVSMAKLVLTSLGDFTSLTEDDDIHENIKNLAQIMSSSDDLKTCCSELSDVFVKCLSTLSVQCPIVATVLSLIHQSEPEFSKFVVDQLSLTLLTGLAEKNVYSCKIALRSLACLSASKCINLTGPNSFVSVFDTLLSVSYDGWRSGDALNANGQICAYLSAHCIPWCAEALSESEDGRAALSRASALFARIATEWKSPFDVSGISEVFVESVVEEEPKGPAEVLCSGPSQSSCWDTLWEICRAALDCCQQVASGSFKAPSCLLRPWLGLGNEFSASSKGLPLQDLTERLRATIDDADINLKSDVTCSHGQFTWLKPCFVIFDADSSPAAAELCHSLGTLEKVLLRAFVGDICYSFEPIIRDDGTKLGSVELLCSHLLALPKLCPGVENLEYLIVECLIQGLFRLPAIEDESCAIRRVILEVCRKTVAAPPIVALAVSILFQLVEQQNTCCWRELAEWLTFHLTNTQLQWPYWSHWAEDLKSCEEDSASKGFCVLVIDRCMRLSGVGPVRDSLPEELKDLVPEEGTPVCPILSGAINGCGDVVEKINSLLENKAEAEELSSFLDGDFGEALESLKTGAGDHWKITLLVEAILGSSTTNLSSITGLFDRYAAVLREHASETEEQQAALATVEEVWGHNGWMVWFCLDALVRRGVVQVDSMADWLARSNRFSLGKTGSWQFDITNLVSSRAVDLVRAAFQNFKAHGGSLDGLKPSDDSEKGDSAMEDDSDSLSVARVAAEAALESSRNCLQKLFDMLLRQMESSVFCQAVQGRSAMSRLLREVFRTEKDIAFILGGSLELVDRQYILRDGQLRSDSRALLEAWTSCKVQ